MNKGFLIGWQEWVSLPDLGVPAIKAKVDTGARTSALHAFLIEPYGPASAPMVRFGVHPIPGRLDIAIMCEAPVIDRRDVTSSNGETEKRYFIKTPVSLGDRTWTIEIGLTNRESMAYRMLLGRTALREGMVVDATASFRQPKLNYKHYRSMTASEPARHPLRIAMLASQGASPFNRRLAAAAAERGHAFDLLELERLSLTFAESDARLHHDGSAVEAFDVVIARARRRDAGTTAAVLRHMQASGAISIEDPDAILRAADRTSVAQRLISAGLPQSVLIGAVTDVQPVAPASRLDILVVQGDGIAILDTKGDRTRSASLIRNRGARRLAEQAADAVGLNLAGVIVDMMSGHPVVAAISSNPRLATFARHSGEDIASRLLDVVEARIPARTSTARSGHT